MTPGSGPNQLGGFPLDPKDRPKMRDPVKRRRSGKGPSKLWALLLVLIVGGAIVFGGTGGGGKPKANREPSNVSPACETTRESLRLEAANPNGNPRYVSEDEELVEEECGSAARARWARIQHEQSPEGEAEKAQETAENAVQVEGEVREVEEVLKQREAERTANALEGR